MTLLNETFTGLGTFPIGINASGFYTILGTLTLPTISEGSTANSQVVVTMNVNGGLPSPLGVAATYGLLAATAITNTGNTVITGNVGEFPGSTLTGFPPGTISGSTNLGTSPASIAQAAALSAYTTMQAASHTGISSILDGQTLTPGTYKATSGTAGTFTLAQSGNGTVTLNGAGTYVFQMDSTLTTGAGGTPTITLSGGATAANVFWVVGSSATINSGHTGVFQGNIIALTSITDTLGGTVNGSLIALNAAVTLSAATAVNVQIPGGSFFTGLAGSESFGTGISMLLGDTLNIILSSSAPVDQGNNTIKTTLSMYS